MLCRVVLLTVLLASPLHAETRWQMPTIYPSTTIVGEGLSLFSKSVGERTGGEIVVTPAYEAAASLKSSNVVAEVRENHIPAGDQLLANLDKIDPIFGLSSLPFVAVSIAEAARLADLARPFYEKALARQGQRLLYLAPWPPSGIWSRQPLRSPSQLQGLSIRTYDATSEKVLAGAGAKAVQLSFPDTTPKLKDGSLDAVLSSGDGGAGRGYWAYLPHFLEINYAFPLSAATLNEKVFAALPDAQKTAITDAARQTEKELWARAARRLEDNYARMRANNVTIDQAPDKELMTALRASATKVVEAWLAAAGPEVAAVLKHFQAK